MGHEMTCEYRADGRAGENPAIAFGVRAAVHESTTERAERGHE